MSSNVRVKPLIFSGGLLSVLFIVLWISVLIFSSDSLSSRFFTSNTENSLNPKSVSFSYSDIRVAIYYEANKTNPVYTLSYGGAFYNETTVLKEILGS